MRGFLITLLVAVVVVGCGSTPTSGPVSGNYRLYEAASNRSGQFVNILDAKAHTTLGLLPLGTPSADWTHFYAVRSGILEDIDPQTGVTVHTLALARPYQMPPAAMSGMTGGLSQNGRWAVLETGGGPPSHLLVVDTSFTPRPVAVDLGTRLYLLEYLSGNEYRVRFYDLAAHRLDPNVVVDKSDPHEPMTGQRLATVASSGGDWQFTVYARAKKGAFIHALNMSNPISLCFELPGAGWETDPSAFHWSLALSPDGSRLYATNGALGVVTEMSASENNGPGIMRSVHIAKQTASGGGLVQTVDAKEMGSGGAVVSRDGHTLVMTGSSGVIWIDTTTLRTTARALDSWTVWSLALSPDGSALYALEQTGDIAELSMAGAVTSTFDPNVGQPMALMRVQAPRA
jgi:hypothetical protein